MASNPKKSAAIISAVMLAGAAGTTALISDEGWVTRTYSDIVGVKTACAGVVVKESRTYTDQECQVMTAQAELKIGLAIAQCLPEKLPVDTRAAYQRFAYNIGPAAFCKSSVAARARAGDLGGSCYMMSKYVYAGGKKNRGLEARRAREIAQCQKGLRE